jgi:Zn-dependent peptidase ImmA (M78 family)
VNAFHDFELFDSTSFMEYEANIFAAEFLMDDDDVLEKLNEDISFFGAASLLRVPPELLDFKFRLMKRNGYKLIDPPLMANANFLKSVETEVTDEY